MKVVLLKSCPEIFFNLLIHQDIILLLVGYWPFYLLFKDVLQLMKTHLCLFQICQSCCGRMHETECISLDCPVLYRLCQARKDLRQADYVRSLQQEFLEF